MENADEGNLGLGRKNGSGSRAGITDGGNTRAITYRAIGSLIPYAQNARTHSAAQVALIAGLIRDSVGPIRCCSTVRKLPIIPSEEQDLIAKTL